jgi:hypothetical protein
MAPTCSNCGGTEFVWAGNLKTGGRLSQGPLSLRNSGELPLGTRLCRRCGHADLFLRDVQILQNPHHWKPGEFVPIASPAPESHSTRHHSVPTPAPMTTTPEPAPMTSSSAYAQSSPSETPPSMNPPPLDPYSPPTTETASSPPPAEYESSPPPGAGSEPDSYPESPPSSPQDLPEPLPDPMVAPSSEENMSSTTESGETPAKKTPRRRSSTRTKKQPPSA